MTCGTSQNIPAYMGFNDCSHNVGGTLHPIFGKPPFFERRLVCCLLRKALRGEFFLDRCRFWLRSEDFARGTAIVQTRFGVGFAQTVQMHS